MGRGIWFWNRIAKSYSRKAVPDEGIYQQKLERTRAYLTPDSEVLEFGCGTGTTALWQALHVKHILAIDYSAKMIAIARGKALDLMADNVTFQQSDIESLDAPDGSYDMVMGHSILHLLPNKDEVVGKVWHLLKPGGVFVSSTVVMAEVPWLMKKLLPVGSAIGILPQVRFFSQQELEASMTGAGFEIVESWKPDDSDAVFLVVRKPV